MKTKSRKKVFAGNGSHFFPKSGEDLKKKSLPQYATTLGRKFVGSFSPGWLFFVWSSSAQLSMGGRLNLDWGMLNLDGGTLTLDGDTRPPRVTLQFKYWLYVRNTTCICKGSVLALNFKIFLIIICWSKSRNM